MRFDSWLPITLVSPSQFANGRQSGSWTAGALVEVDRIPWNAEPLRQNAENCFELLAQVAASRRLLKLNFPRYGFSFLRADLRALDVVVLFVDWKFAETLHFSALPLHLDAARAVHSTMDRTVIWRSCIISASEKLLSCTKAEIPHNCETC